MKRSASVKQSNKSSSHAASASAKRPSALWKTAFAVTALAGMISAAYAADPLKGVLTELLEVSPRVAAANSDKEGAAARVSETFRRAWTPTLDLTVEGGTQRYETESVSNPPRLGTDRTSLRATQLLYDFGRTGHQVSETESVASQSAAVASATRDGLLLEALTAHWSSVRAQRVLEYSKQSEASVRNQAKLENSLVELGKGYESNLLQAKVQLASAEARRVRAEGALDIAQARVNAVFGTLTKRVVFEEVALPVAAKLPKSLDEAKALALEHNQQLKIGVHRSQAIRERVAGTSAKEFLPRLQLVAESGSRHDVDTTRGGTSVNDSKVAIQLQYTLNAGMAGSYAVDSVQRELDASVSREIETRDLVLEQVNIAWRNMLVAKQNKDTLSNQVRIAAKFFEMASAERQMGRRSLLDVLTAEVSLINALSDLVSTEADAAIAGLTLMQAIGQLNVDSVVISPLDAVMPKLGAALPAEIARKS